MGDDARRRLLHRTDNILEGVEQLRLRGARYVPDRLHMELGKVASEIAQPQPPRSKSLDATHDYLFRLQSVLLRAGSQAQQSPRASGAPRRDGIPTLSLPQRGDADEASWRETVTLTVQRARDLVRYLNAQAEAARALSGEEAAALAATRSDQADSAWQQYERLANDARTVHGGTLPNDLPGVLPAPGQLTFQDLVIDDQFATVQQDGDLVALTPIELKVLKVLGANQGTVVSREAMLHLVYGDNPSVNVRSNVIDMHLGRLRAKLGDPPYLQTVRGIGFRASMSSADRPATATEREAVRQRRRERRQAWARGSRPLASDYEPSQAGPQAMRSRWQANKRY